MDDNTLITAIATGDHQALRELFLRHAPWMAGRLRRALPADAVEDVLQEVFLAAWRGARSYHGKGEVGAWLWGIARRQAALWVRNAGRVVEPQMVDVLPTGDFSADAVARADLAGAFAALGPAGNADRELAQLVFVEERSMADVAARLGIPVGTVKSRIFKLRQRLQAVLRRGDE